MEVSESRAKRRFLVIGCGSIGRRHIGNLVTLQAGEIKAFDLQEDRRRDVMSQFEVETVSDLSQAWKHHPDVVLITTPTRSHIALALEAAQHGCHLFIEKPLSDTLEGVDRLLDVVKEGKLITLVGCNMRFHHGPATIKGILMENNLGRVCAALLDAGQYLPDWHPYEDYRNLYASRRSMGGGVILDGIHEIDYARWLFGEVEEVFCFGGKLSNLQIDTEDCANILMKFSSGFSAHLHVDYIQRAYSRSCKVICEEGSIFWDIVSGPVKVFDASSKKWTAIDPPQGYDINRMYLEEMRHFLRCLDGKEPSVLDVRDSKRVLEIALAIKESMKSGKMREV